MSQTPVDVLFREHQLHRRMLAVLEQVAIAVELGAAFPAEDVATMLTYFREFVETVHKAKEGEHFFPAVMMHGPDSAAESVGAVLAEQEENKLLLHTLTLFWEPGDLLEEERRGFADVARTYSSKMRRQMDIEQEQLFSVAAHIPQSEQQRMSNSFETIGADRRSFEHWHAEVARLESGFLSG